MVVVQKCMHGCCPEVHAWLYRSACMVVVQKCMHAWLLYISACMVVVQKCMHGCTEVHAWLLYRSRQVLAARRSLDTYITLVGSFSFTSTLFIGRLLALILIRHCSSACFCRTALSLLLITVSPPAFFFILFLFLILFIF